jgi:hypothetical protein
LTAPVEINSIKVVENMKCAFCPEKQAEFCRRIAYYTTGKQRMLFPVKPISIRRSPVSKLQEPIRNEMPTDNYKM